jgi:hypothetical protein
VYGNPLPYRIIWLLGTCLTNEEIDEENKTCIVEPQREVFYQSRQNFLVTPRPVGLGFLLSFLPSLHHLLSDLILAQCVLDTTIDSTRSTTRLVTSSRQAYIA